MCVCIYVYRFFTLCSFTPTDAEQSRRQDGNKRKKNRC